MSIATRLRRLEQRRDGEAMGAGMLFTWNDDAGEAHAAVVTATGEALPLDVFRRRYPQGTIDLHLAGVDPHRV